MLSKKQIREIEEALEKIEITKETLPFFLYVFDVCNEPFITNILAYKFGDLKDTRAIPYFIKHLKNIKAYMYRGNVLSALREFDYTPYVDLLLKLLATGNYEVSVKAAAMLMRIQEKLSNKQKAVLAKLVKEKKAALREYIDFFTDISNDLA